MADGLKKWMGGSPLAVVGRLVLVSILVGIVLAALRLDPFDISVEQLRWLWRYFLLGTVIIIPIWLIMRLLNAPTWLKELAARNNNVRSHYDHLRNARAAHRAQNLHVMKPETLKRIRTLKIMLTAAFILGGGTFAVQHTLNPQPYDYQARIDLEVHPIASIIGALSPYIILAPFAYWFSGWTAQRIDRKSTRLNS